MLPIDAELNHAELSSDVPTAVRPTCEADCRVHAYRKPMWMIVGWLGAMLASVPIGQLPYEAGNDWCGIWGCLPPLMPLVELHLLWTITLAFGAWFVFAFRPRSARTIGYSLLGFALLAAGVLIAIDLPKWLGYIPDDEFGQWSRRVLYIVGTTPLVPIVPAIWTGMFCVVFGKKTCHQTTV